MGCNCGQRRKAALEARQARLRQQAEARAARNEQKQQQAKADPPPAE